MHTEKGATVVSQLDRDMRLRQQAHEDAQTELAKKNFDFLQLEKRNIKEVRGLIGRSPKASIILMLLAEHMNKQNAIVMSMQTLMSITKWSRPTVSGAIKLLKDERWLQVLKIGTANAYIINNSVFWQSSRDQKLSYFSAQIVASSNEQDESTDEMAKLKLRHFPFAEIKEANEKGVQILISGEELPPPDQAEMDI
jgi:hypothetical protein